MNKHRFPALAGTLLLVAGCSGPNQVDDASDAEPTLQTLTGEVFYREQHYLPPGAHLNMFLETAPAAGSPSNVIATSKTLLAGSQPYSFTLQYSSADIDARTQYNLRATITFYGDLLFTSATRLDPFTYPEDTISVRVTRVGPP